MKKFFLVDKDFENSRLDRWIRKNIFTVPQSIIEKSIRKGLIKINDKKEKVIKIFTILNISIKLDCEIDQNMTIESN